MDINEVISLLESSHDDDNKKFALLILIANLMKENKLSELDLNRCIQTSQSDQESAIRECKRLNVKLFNSIGAHFLARLITATKTPDSCSQHIYKSISMAILMRFADYPHLITDALFLSKFDTICSMLTLKPNVCLNDESLDDEKKNEIDQENKLLASLVDDTFGYMFVLGEHCPDQLFRLDARLATILVDEIVLVDNEFYYTPQIDISACIDDVEHNGNLVLVSACRLLMVMFKSCRRDIDKTHLKVAFVKLLNQVAERHDRFKFNLLKVLNFLLDDVNVCRFINDDAASMDMNFGYLSVNDASQQRPEEHSIQRVDCSRIMFKILNDLFKSSKSFLSAPSSKQDRSCDGLDNKMTNISFNYLNHFVKLYQFEFIYLKNRQFFYFLIHLLCSQVGYNLKMKQAILMQTQAEASKQNSSASNEENRSEKASSDVKFLNKISIYFSLLEEIIIILSTASPFNDLDDDDDDDLSDEDDSFDDDDDDDDSFDDKHLFDSIKSLSKPPVSPKKKKSPTEPQTKTAEPELDNAIKSIVELLQYLIEFLKDTFDGHLDEQSDDVCLITVSSVRLLMCWMCHETLLEDELVKLYPNLIDFGKRLTTNSRVSRVDLNLFQLLRSGMERLLNDKREKVDSMKSRLKSHTQSLRSNDRMGVTKSASCDPIKLEFDVFELEQDIADLTELFNVCKSQCSSNI